MHQFEFVAPRSSEDAISQLHERGPGGKILAGGTDLLLQVKARTLRPTYVVDLSHLTDLVRLEMQNDGGLWIGSMVRMRTIQQSPLIKGKYAIVSDGASLVGSIQIRNLATIGGNLCNAAPSADVAPPLIAVSASAEILGQDGRRSVPIEQFFLGPRRTVLNSDELLLGVFIPGPTDGFGGKYIRHTPRREMDIAVVGVGSTLTIKDGLIVAARIVLGAVAPTPIRATRAEQRIIGNPASVESIGAAAVLAADEARPISDVRGSADYRRHLVEVLARRTLTEATLQATGGTSNGHGGTVL